MAGFDLTRAQAYLKRTADKHLNELSYSFDNAKLNPGFVSLRRDAGKKVVTPFGEAWEMAVEHAIVAATSASDTDAEAIAADSDPGSGPSAVKFLITPKTMYTFHQVHGDVLDRCKDAAAWVNAGAKVTKDALKAHMRRLCIYSDGNGTGSLCQASAVNASPAYIDVPIWAMRKFQIGDRLVAAAAESSGGLRNATALRVTSRNRQSATTARIGLSSDPTAISWAANDWIFFKGDRNAVYKGTGAWAPPTAPSSGESFFSVDRSVDDRLGGLRFDMAGLDLRPGLIQAANYAAVEGSVIERCRISFEDYATLLNEGEELKTVSLDSDNLVIGFKGVMLHGGGSIAFSILPDESIQPGSGIMETKDGFHLLTADGDIASIVSHDGLVLRKVAGDNWQCVVKSMLQPASRMPGHQLRLNNVGL